MALYLDLRGHSDSIVSIALSVGHIISDNPEKQLTILERLRDQVDALSDDQRKNLYNQVVVPLITNLLLVALGNSENVRVLKILKILKSAAPHLRTKDNWNLKVLNGIVCCEQSGEPFLSPILDVYVSEKGMDSPFESKRDSEISELRKQVEELQVKLSNQDWGV